MIKDLYYYFLNSPQYKTLIRFSSAQKKEDYSNRILQRLDISVNQYSVVNVHKIGIEIPGRYIFEELMKWDDKSEYWPNAIARIKRISGQLDHIEIYLFGIERIFHFWNFGGIALPPLFYLKKLRFNATPHTSDLDNARSLLYTCEGGYPIGIFSLYVRSSIAEQNEYEKAQLFSMVAFNFYGKKKWYYTHLINPVWEVIHNRATANILNRVKKIFESKFNQEIDGMESREKVII